MEAAQVTSGGQEQARLPRQAAMGVSADGGAAAAAAGSGADSSGEDTGDWAGGGLGQDGAYRKRGRPRKYEGLDEVERRKRRMADNRQSAKRSYYRKVNRMKELEEENSSLRSELGAELAKLAEIDAETQERMLSVTQRMGTGLLDPELLAKFARKQDLSLPLFQHAAKVAQAAAADPAQQQQADDCAQVGIKLPVPAPAAASTDLGRDQGLLEGPSVVKQERGNPQQPAYLHQVHSQAWAAAALDPASSNTQEAAAVATVSITGEAEATGSAASSEQAAGEANLERAGGEPATT